eukprot:TRINITY_DN35820_c0_g1_i1.p1 TRINITY_DN35820_c0_g1~~TRINITY_DN35820_c0_g1_i1.p1  ORF type:complete len:447 (+),score=68.48 TRINITY_DN35820_c0_g1_i1:58-1341(+)
MSERDSKRPRVTLVAKSDSAGGSRETAAAPRATNALEIAETAVRNQRLEQRAREAREEREAEEKATRQQRYREEAARSPEESSPEPERVAASRLRPATAPSKASVASRIQQPPRPPKRIGGVLRRGVASSAGGAAVRTATRPVAAAGAARQRVASSPAQRDAGGTSLEGSVRHAPAKGPSSVVHFDVSGEIFRVPTTLLRFKPHTLLARLLAEAEVKGTGDKSSPIPVEVAPDRFQYILDWYRYDELLLPRTINADAVLRDARQLELPDEVVVNGVLRSSKRELSANKVSSMLMADVIDRWPTWRQFYSHTLNAIRDHYQSVAVKSVSGEAASEDPAAEEAFDVPRFVMPIFGDDGWLKPKQIGSTARARVLAVKLEELGYLCEFTESELMVGLPLRLRCEAVASNNGADGLDDEEPADGAEGDEKS